LQTIIIKLDSKFEGEYFWASKRAKSYITHSRPFYVLIFGESKLLNKYFSEEYISKSLKGFNSMARFFKLDGIAIPYQATTQNILGSFSFDKLNKNKLNKSSNDRNGHGFQFTIAVDYSLLPLSDNYLKLKENYIMNSNFSIVNIVKPVTKIFEVTKFTPTHLITVHNTNAPNGVVELNLKYNIPPWISETNIDQEDNIESDASHTFGFKYLTNAITEAYEFKNNKKNIATFKFEISK
jgi:hypothetical protein